MLVNTKHSVHLSNGILHYLKCVEFSLIVSIRVDVVAITYLYDNYRARNNKVSIVKFVLLFILKIDVIMLSYLSFGCRRFDASRYSTDNNHMLVEIKICDLICNKGPLLSKHL